MLFRLLRMFALAGVLTLTGAAVAEDADHGGDSHADGAHADEGHPEEGHADGDHAAHGEAEEGPPDPLVADVDLAIWTLVVFVGLSALLGKFAWKPIIDGLAMREATISGNYKAAEEKHEQAKALLADHQAKLASTADEVKALLDEARRDAEHTKDEIVAEAKAAADAERQRAVRDIDQAKDVVVRELAERTAGLAIDLATRVVQQDITPERQNEIVETALGRFASSEPSAN